MTRSHDRTLLANLGFADPDKKNPLHDLACQYLALPENAGRLLSSRLPAAPSIEGGYAGRMGNGRDATFTLERTEVVVGPITASLEAPLSKGDGQYRTTIGFLDVLLTARPEWRYHGQRTTMNRVERAVTWPEMAGLRPDGWAWEFKRNLPAYSTPDGPCHASLGVCGAGYSTPRTGTCDRGHGSRSGWAYVTATPGATCTHENHCAGTLRFSGEGDLTCDRCGRVVTGAGRGTAWRFESGVEPYTTSLSNGVFGVGVEVKAGPVGIGDVLRQIALYRQYAPSYTAWVLATTYAPSALDVETLKREGIHHIRLGPKFTEWAEAQRKASTPPAESEEF